MQANRGRDTGPELALRRAVHAQGLRYFVNRRPVKNIRRTADMVFPKARVAVFMDGCFWHGCPDHHTAAKTNADFWAAKVEDNRRRDAETDKLMAASGWTVIRIWEHVPVMQAANLVISAVEDTRECHQHTAQRAADRRSPPTAGEAESRSLSAAVPPPR